MRLTDKRFLIFEGFCILYSVLLMEIVDLLFGSSMLGFKLIIACMCLISGLMTWLMAYGKRWAIFGIIYEVISLLILSAIFWVSFFISTPLYAWIFKETYADIELFGYLILTIGTFTLLPTFGLAFFGYQLFRRDKDKNGIG
ncbi:hypothetical protein [Muribaculum intestinale]|uniref:hypothetical protein n=1 Tax=Muribaculum intestinale TaxID=1796646 RepID=UPI00242E6BF3|nr:hypothetical protein [Muribaculum intestinale]